VRSTTSGRFVVLSENDRSQLLEFLHRDPVANLFVLARVNDLGIDRLQLGCDIYGYYRGNDLTAICHNGSNLVPIGDDDEAFDAFADRIRDRRHTSSIMGKSDAVRGMWERLSLNWPAYWGKVREIRHRQPLMVIEGPPQVDPDPRVHRIGAALLDPYFDSAVKMYTEEVGVSPLEPTQGYRNYVRKIIADGRAFGVFEDGIVIFKSDIGSAHDKWCQVQGVWLHPSLRGQGASLAAMASVVNLCQERHPVVSLYVNDFNTRARKLYERVGFDTVGEFATVLY